MNAPVHPMPPAGRSIRMRHICSYIAALALIGAVTGCPAGQYYQGYAYAAADDRLLYRETHWLYAENGVEHRLVLYSCPDGEPFVRKQVDSAPGAASATARECAASMGGAKCLPSPMRARRSGAPRCRRRRPPMR